VLPEEEFLGEVNSWELSDRARDRWPFQRVVAPRWVDQVELNRYLGALLASGRWLTVRTVPRVGRAGRSDHVFDVYGRPARTEPGGGPDGARERSSPIGHGPRRDVDAEAASSRYVSATIWLRGG